MTTRQVPFPIVADLPQRAQEELFRDFEDLFQQLQDFDTNLQNISSTRLGGINPAATTETVIYSAPVTVRYVADMVLYIAEIGAANATFRISITATGGTTANTDYLAFDSFLGANETISFDGLSLPPGYDIRARASTANVAFNVFGVAVS